MARKRARGRTVDFHGAFLSKEDAMEREAEVPNSFIMKIRVQGQRRFAVVTRKDRKAKRRA